jgi:aminopeptidase N
VSGSTRPAPDAYDGGHGSAAFHVAHYDLDLSYRLATNRLIGCAVLQVQTLRPAQDVTLDFAGLAVEKVRVVGDADLASHRHRDGRLRLRLSREVPAGTRLSVTVRYRGSPTPLDSPWGPLGWEELTDGVVVANQPTGAPSWFPCNDRPSDKATYRTRLTVDNGYRALAHGRLASRRVGAGTTTWTFEQDQPTPTYLATVQIGRYEDVVLATTPVPQLALVPPILTAAARDRLAWHGELMALFTDLFGPYPFDGYTLVVTRDLLEIPVEAQGVAIFGANHLTRGGDGARLVPHELAHQWFGNSVSVASWRDIWLNEGFACYAEWLWSQASGGPSTQTLAQHWHGRLRRAPQDLVLADPGPARIFDDRVYKRGALTLHALRQVVGDDAWRLLVRDWATRHRYRSVTTDDFRAHAAGHARAAGGDGLARSVDALLGDWLDRCRLPPLPPA